MKRILALVGLGSLGGGTVDVEIFGHGSVFGIPLGSIFGGSGLLIAGFVFVSFRQLRESRKTGSSFTQFSLDQIQTSQTSTRVTYLGPKNLVPATAANTETVDIWLGPMLRVDKGAINTTTEPGGKEVVKQAENTLLFMPTQAIAIMLTPADLANVRQGVLGRAASVFIKYFPQAAVNKGVEFRMLHKKHWDELMSPLLQMPLSSILQTHFNYAIPYSKVQSVEVKRVLTMPGIKFHLMDGSTLSYQIVGHDARDQAREIERYLLQRVTIDS